jgi:hypothetical protein
LNKIQDHLREFYVDKKGYPYVADENSEEMKEINWLKSLKPQPHWKPSEEQMKTLVEWLKNHQYDGDSRYIYPIFQSLYNGLKNFDMTQYAP